MKHLFFALSLVLISAFLILIGRPVTLEGRVIKKDIAETPEEDSYIIITIDQEKIKLLFTTHQVKNSILIGIEDFHGKTEYIDKINIDDVITVETYDRNGKTREVCRLLSVR